MQNNKKHILVSDEETNHPYSFTSPEELYGREIPGSRTEVLDPVCTLKTVEHKKQLLKGLASGN